MPPTSERSESRFAPPFPPETFGWRRPGPAVMKYELRSDTSTCSQARTAGSQISSALAVDPGPGSKGPKTWKTSLQGFKDDESATYWISQTFGSRLEKPTEAAGPIATRQGKEAQETTISNTVGNLCVNIVSRQEVQYWALTETCGQAAWVAVTRASVHPTRKNYKLSLANQYKPAWIKAQSLESQTYPSRMPFLSS
ncbi:hypothetical protein AURDEDRAFT_176833 [Auricularia subglabra TFB-10046 SS5]|nr:hypothetical protein AURDEDRAFT_176833 [Auricularia subglabra TFB-10046 SS5]